MNGQTYRCDVPECTHGWPSLCPAVHALWRDQIAAVSEGFCGHCTERLDTRGECGPCHVRWSIIHDDPELGPGPALCVEATSIPERIRPW